MSADKSREVSKSPIVIWTDLYKTMPHREFFVIKNGQYKKAIKEIIENGLVIMGVAFHKDRIEVIANSLIDIKDFYKDERVEK